MLGIDAFYLSDNSVLLIGLENQQITFREYSVYKGIKSAVLSDDKVAKLYVNCGCSEIVLDKLCINNGYTCVIITEAFPELRVYGVTARCEIKDRKINFMNWDKFGRLSISMYTLYMLLSDKEFRYKFYKYIPVNDVEGVSCILDVII